MQATTIKMYGGQQGRLWRGALIVLCLSMGAGMTQGAHAQDTAAGFQSDVTGGIPIQFAVAPGGSALGGTNASLAMGSLPGNQQTELQASLQTLGGATAGLPTADLVAAGQATFAAFPDSAWRRKYQKALSAVLRDIAFMNQANRALVSGDMLSHAELVRLTVMSGKLKSDLASLVAVTRSLSRSASPAQKLVMSQTYDAIEKAVAGLEQLAPALATALRLAH